jgi:uncharacterized MAPEG superfamily protein
MSASAVCLLGLIGWTIFLLFVLLGARGHAIFSGGHEPNIFDQQGTDVGPFGQRITRAQANSLEWLTIPAALLVYGIATGQSAVTDGLAMVVLYTRLAQSVAHLISTALPMILVRATLFTVQVVIWIIWAWGFYGAA